MVAARLRRGARRVRLAGNQGAEEQPVLPRSGAVPRPLLGLPHAVGGRRAGLGHEHRQPRRTNGPNFNYPQGERPNRCSTRSATAASPARSCPRTSSSATTRRTSRTSSPRTPGTQAKTVPDHEHHAVDEIGRLRGGGGRARPQTHPGGPRRGARGARAPRRARRAGARRCDRARRSAGVRCCPSSRACAPSRTRRTRASAPRRTPPSGARDRGDARGRRARAKELERELAAVDEAARSRRSRRSPTCPTRPPRPDPRTSSCARWAPSDSSTSSPATTSSSPAR